MMELDWTPADLNVIVGNPIYAINIDPLRAEPHPPLISEEQWIAANVNQTATLGPEAYLRNLLSILNGKLHPVRAGVSGSHCVRSGPRTRLRYSAESAATRSTASSRSLLRGRHHRYVAPAPICTSARDQPIVWFSGEQGRRFGRGIINGEAGDRARHCEP
jgi:hypothetical protein